MMEDPGNAKNPNPATGTDGQVPPVGTSETLRDTECAPPPFGEKKWSRPLLLLFCCWHAGFLIFSVLPRLPGQDLPGYYPVDLYRLVTGSRQMWRLFHTIPVMRSLRIHLEATQADGKILTAGCLLPGFTPYPLPENSRFFTLFERMLTHPIGELYREAYIRKVNHLQNANTPLEEHLEWNLVFEGEAIRNLFYSRIDRQVSAPFTKRFGTPKAEEKQP
jgi:hypothetical protein